MIDDDGYPTNDLLIEFQKASHDNFDDRNQVVEMWRGLGLPVYQVADGDF